MAWTITKHVHINGSRILKVDYHGISDGTTQLSLYPLIDIADFEPYPRNKFSPYFKVTHLEYAFTAGLDLKVYWENTGAEGNKVLFFPSTNEHMRVSWQDRGGETNRGLSEATGRILVTSVGAAANDTFFFSFCIQKMHKTAGEGNEKREPVNPQTGAGHSDGATVGTPQGVPPTGSAERT